jgi:ABC-2 type transport system permease protein
MKTMEGFQVIMNFLLMPIFFLSGALFPLANLPGWLTVLTHIDPVSYALDAIRRIILLNAGVPNAVVDQLGISLYGLPLTAGLDLLLLVGFAMIMILLAVRAFEIQE